MLNSSLGNKNIKITNSYTVLGSAKSISANGTIISLTVSNGTYLILGYISGAAAWYKGITDKNNKDYMKVENDTCFCLYRTHPGTISFSNLNGATKTYNGCTQIMAIKFSND